MLYSFAALLLAPRLALTAVLPRDDVPQEITDAFKGAGIDPIPHKRPNQYIRAIWSPGDSFTAGVGSNGPSDYFKESGNFANEGCARYAKAYPEQLRDHSGWGGLQGDNDRRNNFGACSGATMGDIEDKQLKQGPTNDGDKYKMIGEGENAPQIAALTAGGNDLDFSTIIKACVYGYIFHCDQKLKDAEDKLGDKDKLKGDYHKLWANVLAAGRKASVDAGDKGGASPAESFQIFHSSYVPFFNEDTEFCNDITWSYITTGQSFTHERRKKLNDLVRGLNDIIKEAADEWKSWGVVFVDGHIDNFKGHQFCDEVPDNQPIPGWPDQDYNKIYWQHQGIGPWTWFWSLRSPWQDNYEGPDNRPWPHDPYDGDQSKNITSNPESIPDIKKAILDKLVPDQGQQEQINNGEDPADFNEAFKSDEALGEAIQDLTVKSKDGEVKINLSDGWYRVFHPKGSGHGAIRDAIYDTIVDQRDWTFDGGKDHQDDPPAPSGPTKALTIIAESIPGGPDVDWLFFQTDYGKAIECRSDFANHKEMPWDLDSPNGLTYPGGTYDLKLFDQDCQYKNSGDNQGALFCGDKEIKCVDDPADTNPEDNNAPKGGYMCGDKYREPVFTCAY